MIDTQHDERRRRKLLTQREVAEQVGCSVGRLQFHTRCGKVELPGERLGSKFYYTQMQAKDIGRYFKNRERWQRVDGHDGASDRESH